MLFSHLRALGLIVTLAIAGLLASTGCTTNPATGRSNFNMLSENEEIEIGSEAAPEFIEQYGGPIPDETIQSYFKGIGHRLAATSERPDLPWEFHALDSSVINAFALPGGKVFITRGLIERLEDEAQLAGIIGHEIGHVTAQHIGQQMSQAILMQAGIAILGATVSEDYQWAVLLGGTGGQLYLLSFGRNQESEADTLGMRYMERNGYDPAALLGVMQILAEAGGEGRQPEFLATHPHPETRIEIIKKGVAGPYQHTQNNPQYVRNRAAFQQTVLNRLKNLPAAKHQPQSAQDFEKLEALHAAARAEQGDHACCESGHEHHH